MGLDKNQLNEILQKALGDQYNLEKFFKKEAEQQDVETGYHVIQKQGNSKQILTKHSLGENLLAAKLGLENWIIERKKAASVQQKKRKKTPPKSQIALEFLYTNFPKCFVPIYSDVQPQALAVGIRKAVLERVGDKLPNGISPKEIKRAFKKYCTSKKYTELRKKAGTPRIDLDGNVVGEVTEAEVNSFLANQQKSRSMNKAAVVVEVRPVPTLNNKESSSSAKIPRVKLKGTTMPNNQIARIEVQGLKITLPLKSEQVPREILPAEGTPGASKMKLYWDIVLVAEGQKEQVYRVGFSVKNYRKCLKTLDQHQAAGSECIVLLQGKLVNGGTIQDAGLSVQVKIPKAKKDD